ncbi:hypothetical protein MHU86_24849 [Fragilaria crotonensis]|nr:hypothetical protein MHU86_24849 [Fragilaria crotonensis]
MFVKANSTTLRTVSEATMGLKASRLLAIDMVKGLCGDGGEDPLTDCFNKDGEIDDERLESYLMQDDDDDERKTKARIALAYMVGQRIKRKRSLA